MVKYIAILFFILSGGAIFGQNEEGKKTIDITSSFKPSLIPPKKIVPNAAPITGSGVKPTLSYNIPAQQLAFKYTPSPLRPLAFSDTSMHQEDRGYVKAGFGNFSSPYLKAALNFGDGEKTNGNLEGLLTAAKGKLPNQKFARYGIKATSIVQLNENHLLQARGGYYGRALNRYGYKPDTLNPSKDSIALNYNDIHLGGTVGNSKAENFDIYYKATLDAHFFSDNHNGNETSLQYELPLEKELNGKITIGVGVKGLYSSLNLADTAYKNNLTMVSAGAKVKLGDNTNLNAALIPSWNNGDFSLLPSAEIESYLSGEGFAVQAGVVGGFVENTWRSLSTFNPWISQPDRVTNSRNMEVYGAIKGSLNESWFFRVKAHYSKRKDVALFMNDTLDGKSFEVVYEPSMNISGALVELVWQKENKYSLTNRLSVQNYGGLEKYKEAYGLLPLELNSSFRGRLLDKLTAKGDLYLFTAPWKIEKGKSDKGKAGIDLSLGGEFDLTKNLKLWLQFNNLFNNEYQRWNQYPTLGFQAIGGVILSF